MIHRRGPSLIGIDPGARSIAAVQLDGDGAIGAAMVIARPPEGDGALGEEEARALEAVLYRRGFTGRDAALGMPDAALLTEVLELPPRSSGAPIEQLARNEVARTAKRDPASFEIACWEIPAPARAGEATHLMAAGCGHAEADRLLDALESAGFRVRALDARAWALARACRPFLGSTGPAAVLDIGEYASLLALVHSGTLVYQRPMRDAGLGKLRAAIATELSVAPDVADYLLGGIGRETTKGDRRGAEGAARDAAAVADEHIEALIGEVRTALEYAGHRYPEPVQKIAVVGPGAGLGGLAERLSATLKVTARVTPPSAVANCPSALSAPASDPVLTGALGLAQWGRAAA
jgi:Tfp pilus assembly PilM family ATPase